MSVELHTLVALDDEVDRGLIETLVTRDPNIDVLDYLDVGGPTASSLGTGDALIVAVADYNGRVRNFVTTANRQHPSRPIVLICPPSVNGYLAEAFDSGVDDVVALPTGPAAATDPTVARQLVFALEKAMMRRRGSAAEPGSGPERNVICVLGLKGGSGKTLTSTNLAVSLATAGRSVVLVDLDLQFGDVSLTMGMNPVRTIYDLVRSGGSLDPGKIEDFLVEHESGVRALLAPVRPDLAAAITVPFLAEVERLLAEMFDFVVIDTPPTFAPEVIGAVDSSTDVLVVAMRDTLSLKNSRLGLETLDRMNYDRGRVKLLLNRANSNVGIEREDVVAILGRDVDFLLPSSAEITRSVNEGIPITTQASSDAAKVFRDVAGTYIEAAGARRVDSPGMQREEPSTRRRRGWLRLAQRSA